MKKYTILFLGIMMAFVLPAQDSEITRVTSVVDSSQIDELILIQSFEVNVPLDTVWEAYTTERGWEGAFVALAEIDFRINGTIQTNYNPKGSIGDSTTILLHIINYIPKKMLTLQAELTRNFPEFMQSDAKDLFNIILFEKLDESSTQVTSYGIGYKNNEKYLGLLKFFIQGNEMSYNNFINYLENGIKAKY